MPIALRSDFDAATVRAVAKKTKEGPQARRLLALAAVYEGAPRMEAAKRQTSFAQRSAGSRCKSSATGCSNSTRTVQTD
jgi:hypothetical protein